MEFLTILFLIGITAEAMTGALAAGRERMDLFGVVIVACVTAIGVSSPAPAPANTNGPGRPDLPLLGDR